MRGSKMEQRTPGRAGGGREDKKGKKNGRAGEVLPEQQGLDCTLAWQPHFQAFAQAVLSTWSPLPFSSTLARPPKPNSGDSSSRKASLTGPKLAQAPFTIPGF